MIKAVLSIFTLASICEAFAPQRLSNKNSDRLRPFQRYSSVVQEEEIAAFITHRDEYDGDAWKKTFLNPENEICYEVEGEFPTDLEGTFFQNGHAKFYVSEDEFHIHPFDADGMVQAVTFENGKAWFRNRYVQTPGFLEELKEKKVMKRGVFGTAKNKGQWWSNIFDVDFKNVANTHVVFMGDDELFALWEAGQPFQLNPTTLETVGESSFYGAIGEENSRYAAHYKIDPRNKNVCGFSILPGDKDPANTHKLCVMEHSSAEKELLYQKYFPFDGLGVSHDCSITENYFVFLQSPFEFKPLPLILGLKGASECIVYDSSAETANIVLIPRGDNDKGPISIPVPPYFSFHTCNAFEENGEVVLDMVVAKSKYNQFASTIGEKEKGYPTKPVWETLEWKTDVPANELLRIRLDPVQSKLISQTSLTDETATVEFPVINPENVAKSYTYAYCATSASATEMCPLQGLAKFNVETGELLEKWLPEPHQYLNEVVFCPKADAQNEDDGYLVTYILDPKEKTNQLAVFDCANPGKGPIATSTLKGWCVNQSLHGVFVPGFTPKLTDEVKATFE